MNYGSGTPAEAAAWVSHARSTAGDSVALWEVGNENYGCWEVNNWLAEAPENFPGYQPNNDSSPATSYRSPDDPGQCPGDPDARDVLRGQRPQLHGRDEAGRPAARIGVPWDFDSSVTEPSVPDNTEWNDTDLGQDGRYVSFVDAHYYPFVFGGATGGSNPGVQQLLQALMSVPSPYGQISAALAASDPGAQVVDR